MPVTYEQLTSLSTSDVPSSYTETQTLLYSISTGMGRDPLDDNELDYLYENRQLRALPAQAMVVYETGLIFDIGMKVEQFLHGEQKFVFHRTLPASGDLISDSRVSEVYDKGPEKGCIVHLEGVVKGRNDREPIFSWSSMIFARGDGGLGGPGGKVPAPHPIPDRAPDIVASLETRPEQALLYRLNGDRNLVHVDPAVARAAGFRQPILHGACSSAIACREIVARVCDYDQTRIAEFGVRYTSPVYPGETIETSIWVDGVTVSFRSRVVERDVVVLDHGRCLLRDVPQPSRSAA